MRKNTLSKTDYETLAQFRRSLRVFLRLSEDAAREVGVTPQQHQILLAIKGQTNREWASISEIADSLQLRHHTVVGLIDRSEAAQLVARKPDPEDRRLVRVSLTEQGEAILSKMASHDSDELVRLRKWSTDLGA